MKAIKFLILGFLWAGSSCVFADDSGLVATGKTPDKVSAPAISAASIGLIKQAQAGNRETATISVIKTALATKTTSAAAVVEAISRELPEMAPVAAGTAGTLQPDQATAIARASVVAAPGEAGKIVESLSRAVPNDYRNIAVTAAKAAPSASKEILDAVSAAIPNLKPSIQLALRAYGDNPAYVADILDQAKSIPQVIKQPANPKPASLTASISPIGPAGPPYIPLSTTPGSSPPDTSGQVPVAGRSQVDP